MDICTCLHQWLMKLIQIVKKMWFTVEGQMFMCFSLSGLRQPSVVKLLSYLRIRWITHWLTDPPFSSSSSYLLLEQCRVWGYRRTQRGNHDYNTPQRDCWKMRSTWTSVLCVCVCVHASVQTTVCVCMCLPMCIYICTVRICESLRVVKGRWKVCVLSPAVSPCHVLQPVCSAQWLELSTLMWWHWLKPQQETKRGRKKDSERQFEGQVEIREKVWDGGFKRERADLDNNCNSSS